MLTFLHNRFSRTCDQSSRRDFLKVGALGAGGVALSDMLRARAAAATHGKPFREKSVVWLWLSGGPTQIETFDPKMSAPAEYRSTTGETAASLPGVSFGGTFPKLARLAHKLAVVRSFAHTNSGHGGGTHNLMTGYDNRAVDNGGQPTRPSIGSTVARVRGANHPVSGIPTYVRFGGIGSDGPSYLGPAYSPFDPRGDALRNMDLAIQQERLDDRLELLHKLDRMNRQIDQSGLMEGLTRFEQQALNLILSDAPKAFNLQYEDPRVVERYGKGLGEQLLRARRLCQSGCGFVTVSFGSWDMHTGIQAGMERNGPLVDHAVATFIEDLERLGLSDSILLVITGEFGRTPRINPNGGRDHWAPLSTLALAGGGLRMGQVVGESAARADVPKTTPVTPQDLLATIYRTLGIDQNDYFLNAAGRPSRLVEAGSPIRELV